MRDKIERPDVLDRLFFANGKLCFREDPNVFDAAIVEIKVLRGALQDALTLCGGWHDDHPVLQRARRALQQK